MPGLDGDAQDFGPGAPVAQPGVHDSEAGAGLQAGVVPHIRPGTRRGFVPLAGSGSGGRISRDAAAELGELALRLGAKLGGKARESGDTRVVRRGIGGLLHALEEACSAQQNSRVVLQEVGCLVDPFQGRFKISHPVGAVGIRDQPADFLHESRVGLHMFWRGSAAGLRRGYRAFRRWLDARHGGALDDFFPELWQPDPQHGEELEDKEKPQDADGDGEGRSDRLAGNGR